MKEAKDFSYEGTCAEGWSSVSNSSTKCYKFMDLQQSWENARNHCKSLAPNNGGDLASIHDPETNNFLVNFEASRESRQYCPWIGAIQHSSDLAHWAWTDGSAFDYSKWKAGEPNGENDKYACMNIHQGSSHHPRIGWWSDVSDGIGQWRRFFCQQNK